MLKGSFKTLQDRDVPICPVTPRIVSSQTDKDKYKNLDLNNFHLPKTSLLIMTCAFAGYELTMEAYKKAIKDKYRFFSYGDALLII